MVSIVLKHLQSTLLVEMYNFIALCNILFGFAKRLKTSFLSSELYANQKLELCVYPSLGPTLGLPHITDRGMNKAETAW